MRKLMVGNFEYEGVFNDRNASIVIDNYDEAGISLWEIEKLIPRTGDWFAFIKAENEIPGFDGFIHVTFIYHEKQNGMGTHWEIEFRKSLNQNGDFDVMIKTPYFVKELHGPSYYDKYDNVQVYDLSFSEKMFKKPIYLTNNSTNHTTVV